MRCSRPCRSISSAKTRPCGAGRHGPRPTATPARLRSRASPKRTRERVEFFEWLQWQADRQLGEVSRRAFELELGVGLYGDLAVSVDRGGAEAWSNQDLYALGASVGAPPDDFNLPGQNWGLPPLIPARLAAVRALRPSSRRCAPTCAMRARCASIT